MSTSCYLENYYLVIKVQVNVKKLGDRRGCDCMVIGFTTTCAISAHHNYCCEFESRLQYYVIKFVSDLRQVNGFLWVLWFPPPIKLTAT
jgi:hypothetical protein